MPLAGIAFDAFGTLFDLGSLRATGREVAGEEGATLADELGVRLQPLTWHATATGQYRSLPELAAISLRSIAREHESDLDQDSAERIAAGLSSLSAFPDVAAALDAVAPTPLAVLSNGTLEGVTALTESAGIRDRFEHLLVADQVGRYKPAPEVYELAVTAFGAQPGDVLLVSGNEWDVAGAQLAGLRGAFIARGRSITRFSAVEPDLVCDELSDLPGALTRL